VNLPNDSASAGRAPSGRDGVAVGPARSEKLRLHGLRP